MIKQGQAPVIIPDERRVEYFNFIAEYDTDGLTNKLAELQLQEIERIEYFISMSNEQTEEHAVK